MSEIKLADTDFIISDVSVTHTTNNFYTESINGVGNSKSRGLHRLGVDFTVTLVDATDIKKFEALMLRIRGRLNPFVLSLQDKTDGKGYCNPLYTDVTPVLANDVAIGNNKFVLGGFSGVIPAGSKFQFPNDTKVYTVLMDTKPNQECEIFPAVRVPHLTKTKLNFAPEPLLRLSGDEFSLTYAKAKEIKLNAVEVL